MSIKNVPVWHLPDRHAYNTMLVLYRPNIDYSTVIAGYFVATSALNASTASSYVAYWPVK